MIDPDAMTELVRLMHQSNYSEKCTRSGTAASHGGRTSLALFAELLFNTNLFDVLNHGQYIFVDAGSGIGQNVIMAGLIEESTPELSIGVELDPDRHDSANQLKRHFQLGRNVKFLKRSFLHDPSRRGDSYSMALEGRATGYRNLPVFMLLNNYEGIFSKTTKSDQVPLQQQFTDSIGKFKLFPIGSIIISFDPLDLSPPSWTVEAFVTDLPKDCLGWHLNPHPNFTIYKHKRVVMNDYTDRCSTRMNVIRKKKFIFANYLKDPSPDNMI